MTFHCVLLCHTHTHACDLSLCAAVPLCAILAVLLGRDAEIVSACGSGKGDVLALTAFAIGGVVFYVCPLVAVVADFVRRLRAMGMFAHFFRGSGGEAEDALVRKIQDHPRTAPAVVVALLPGTIPR